VANDRIQTIFADGFAKIAVVNNTVRVDLVEVEPLPNGTNQERSVARLLLPLNMIPALLSDLGRVINQSGNQVQTQPMAPTPVAAAPSGGTMIPAPPLGPPPRWTPKS
jgi:hypothetical protein